MIFLTSSLFPNFHFFSSILALPRPVMFLMLENAKDQMHENVVSQSDFLVHKSNEQPIKFVIS